MRKIASGPIVFGWCMSNQHEKCLVESGPKSSRITCTCECENHGEAQAVLQGASLRMRSIAKKHNL